MSSLWKIVELRGNSPGVTLLHFVAAEAEEKSPKLLEMPQRLAMLEKVRRLLYLSDLIVDKQPWGSLLSRSAEREEIAGNSWLGVKAIRGRRNKCCQAGLEWSTRR